MARPFRFGLQISTRVTSDSVGVVEQAKAAEDLGYDIVTVADHIGPGLAPFPALAAMAQGTSSVRLGTFVVNAEFRNPVQLAWDAVTLDHLSGGRFELGVGAGHTPAEFAAIGTEKVSGRRRKERLADTVDVLHQLHAGEIVNWDSEFFQLADAQVDAAVQDHLPILVGGNGDTLLRHAGANADIVGLQGLGRTLEDGHRHTVNFTSAHLDDQVASVSAGAASADRQLPELNALVQVTGISDNASELAETRAGLLDRVEGLDDAQIDSAPYVMVGSVTQIVDKIEACRERWGISYFVVREAEAFAPVVERLAGH